MALIGAFAGLGKGLAEVGTALGRDEAKERDAELRRQLQEERLLAQQERQAATIAARAERTAGGSGIDKEKLAEYEALSLGTTVPEGQKFANAIRTGDLSPLATPEPAITGNNPSAYVAPSGNMELTEATRTLLKQKSEVLRQITKQAAFGKEYEQIEKGERTALGNVAARGIIGGELSDPEKLLAIEGKPLFAGTGTVSTNRATGEQQLTDLGKAQAEKARRAPVAGSGRGGTTDRTEDQINRRLDTLRKEADSVRKQLKENQFSATPEEKAAANSRLMALEAERQATIAGSKFKGAVAAPTAPASAASAPRRFSVIGREPG